MKYKYAVSGDMFLCYDRNKEVAAYLHEIPLKINRLSIQRNNVVIRATFAWPDLPENSQLYFCTSEDTIKPIAVGNDEKKMVYTYEVPVCKKKRNLHVYLEYMHIRRPLDIRLSDNLRKDLFVGVSVKDRKLIIWKKDIIHAFRWRFKRLLKR